MSKIQFFQVDSFSDKPFKGNPAGVCLLEKDIPVETMQSIAAEINASETAFLVKRVDGFDLRWFTPTVEVDLCGHGTLASAHILWQEGVLNVNEQARFFTKSGTLTAIQKDGSIELDFPASFEEDRNVAEQIITALNVDPVNVVFSETRFIIELDTESEVRNCKPDFNALKDQEMVIITSKSSDSKYDFISRTFGPSHGIDEDPVTGSSHCCLAPYWSKRLGKSEMFAYQASSRGGEVSVKLLGNRVLFAGKAITVIEGFLLL